MTQLVKASDKIANVRGMLERSRGQMAAALPRHMSADRMLRLTMTSIQRTPALLDCEPRSLIGAVIQAAQLGLEPDGVLGQAYLVPYGNQVQFIPGYRGLIGLARRSGQISTIEARVVHQKDAFTYSFGLKPVLEHVPTTEVEPGEVVAAYAIAHLKDGAYQFDVMLKREVDAIRTRSKAGRSGPWVTDYEEMAKKTVLKRLCKLLPASVELATAVALDDRAEVGLPQDLGVLADTGDIQAPEKPAKALDTLAEQLEKKPEEGNGGDPLAAERDALLTKLDAALTPRALTDLEYSALTQAHLGGQKITEADPAQLADLLRAVEQLPIKKPAKK